MNLFKLLIIYLIFTLSASAQAGGLVVGNGGNIVTCKDSKDSNHGLPLDLYELDNLYGYTHHFDVRGDYEARKLTYDLLHRINELNDTFGFYISFEILTFEITIIVNDNELDFSNDITTSLPTGCSPKTVILQLNQKPEYAITKEFETFIDLHKVALRMHEAVYNLALKQNPQLKSSDNVRRLTAYMFSKEFFTTTDPSELNQLIRNIAN